MLVAESGLTSIPTDLQVLFPPHLVSENHRLWGWKGLLCPRSPPRSLHKDYQLPFLKKKQFWI